MLKIICMLLMSFVISCGNQKENSSFVEPLSSENVGKVQGEQFFSQALQREWKYNVYYPAGYDSSKEYPVIYLLHGAFSDYTHWKTQGEAQIVLDKAIFQKHLPPTIVIMPDGQNTWYTDVPGTNIQRAIEEDLFSYVETNFPVKKSKKYRAIVGNSMGGHGAIVFGMRNPDYFGTVAALSPSITKLKKSPPQAFIGFANQSFTHVFGSPFSQDRWDSVSYNMVYDDFLQKNSPVRFFVTVGTDDMGTPAENSRDFIQRLESDKVEHKYLEIVGGSHSWGFWTLMLEPALAYIGEEFSK